MNIKAYVNAELKTVDVDSYWQPKEEWCDRWDIPSYQVWLNRENGEKAYPEIPFDAWWELPPDCIEEPCIMDPEEL